ncbi:MAG: Sir2 family NAD-dependent protein deacetylase [Pseudomonadota bacterium]
MGAHILTEPQAAAAVLADALKKASRTVVLTGAGLSTESGIPDFRSPGGIWSRMEPIEYDDFLSDEDARLEDWRRRFEMSALFTAAEPNAAHRAIASFAERGIVDLVVTQNIDGLHERAGTPSEKLVEIHGTTSHARCLTCGARAEIADAQQQIEETGTSPICNICGGLLKTAIISFGEPMPEAEFIRAQEAAATCDLFIAAGTSLVVYPVAFLPQFAQQSGARVMIASQAATEQDDLAEVIIRSPIAETFAHLENLAFN